jgi:hypothetical protein
MARAHWANLVRGVLVAIILRETSAAREVRAGDDALGAWLANGANHRYGKEAMAREGGVPVAWQAAAQRREAEEAGAKPTCADVALTLLVMQKLVVGT